MKKTDFDPGGDGSPPLSSSIEPCPDRPAKADRRRHAIIQDPGAHRLHNPDQHGHMPLTKAQQDGFKKRHNDECTGLDSLIDCTIPMADHTLNSIPHAAATQTLDTASIDTGYHSKDGESSICLSDFSSIGSHGTVDSGYVPMRDKSFGANVIRANSESPLPTSFDTIQSARAESWHENTARQKLRNFAHKMNFTDKEFEQSISQLGVDGTDCDKLLNHLVKLRESQPAVTPTSGTKVKKQSSSKSSQPKPEGDSKGLRRIVVDGSNVAMEHGLHQIYSCRGIEKVVKYFQMRGHEHITVFVPAHRLRTAPLQTKDQHLLNELSRQGVVVKTPSRKSSKGHIASYEDRFILKLASMENAIVVSNDQFRDLKSESSAFRETIEKRILPFVFANDQFIPAEDPLGKKGPTLEQFLRVDPYNASSGTCPYGRKCTYGTKCKFGHPEREESYDSALGDSWSGSSRDTSSFPGGSSRDTSSFPGGLSRDTSSFPGGSSRDTSSFPGGSSRDTSSFPGGSQPMEFWAQSTRLMPTADHYNMNIPNNYGPPPSAHYQSYFIPQGASQNAMSNAAHHPSHPYYMRRDGSYAEYPMTRTLPVSPAVRACLHDQSYRSMPQDDIQYQSRQPGHPSVTSAQEVTPSMSATSSSLMSSQEQTSSSLDPLSLDPLSLDVSTSTSASSCDVTAAPLPLNEHQTTATTGSFHSTDLSTQSDEGQRELAAAHRQRNQHPYDAPIQTTDPRYNTYFHLKNLFPEKIVRRVMNKHPTETDPNKITATVLQMQMKAKVVC